MFVNILTEKIINAPIVKYKPILVKDKCKLFKISKLTKSLIWNWSKGLNIELLLIIKTNFIKN